MLVARTTLRVAAGASEMTFDYLKQRKQFGKLIGEFQVLQHRAAHLHGEIEIARAAALTSNDAQRRVLEEKTDALDRARHSTRRYSDPDRVRSWDHRKLGGGY